MASNWYVRSGASGTGTGADWANAKTTLAAAATASASGDRIFVSEDHAESTAGAVTITFPGNILCLCVNHSGTVPPVSADLRTTATVSVGAANAALTINGSAYIYGIAFQGGTSAGTSANIPLAQTTANKLIFKSCALKLRNGSGTVISLATTAHANEIVFDNTTITFGSSASQTFSVNCNFLWKNTASAVSWTTQPTVMFTSGAVGNPFLVRLEGVDLSNFTNTLATAQTPGSLVVKDCKLNASVTSITAQSNASCTTAEIIRSSSSNVNYNFSNVAFEATLTTETTITRTGGATDGAQAQSWKIVTGTGPSLQSPYELPQIKIWNDTVNTSLTITMYGIWSGGTSPDVPPNNDDIWFDVVYLGDSSSPLASFATTCKADFLASSGVLSTDNSTWGGSQTAFKMSTTFTAQKKGYVYIYPKIAKASTTFYLDPQPVITGAVSASRFSLGDCELSTPAQRLPGLQPIETGMVR